MIGENIKKYREAKGLSQEMLGELSHLTYISIGNYEREIRSPQIDVLQRIADALDVSISCLVDENPFDNPFLTFIHSLGYLVAADENRNGYIIQQANKNNKIFLESDTLDKVKDMIEVDLKKLLLAFGNEVITNDGE